MILPRPARFRAPRGRDLVIHIAAERGKAGWVGPLRLPTCSNSTCGGKALAGKYLPVATVDLGSTAFNGEFRA